METDEFLIGQPLTGVSIIEDKEFPGNELCLDQIQLVFDDIIVTLLPITDTDEIEIIHKISHRAAPKNTPSWCRSFLGKKLMTVWVCENDQGYQDQVIFAFEYLRPSLAFVAEGSVLKLFRYQPIYRTTPETQLQHSQVF